MKVEDEYLDVLQNIEFALASVYRDDPEMTDWQTLKALEQLIRVYRAEQRKRNVPAIKLDGLALEAFERAKSMCDIRLGRTENIEDQNVLAIMGQNGTPVSLDVIVAGLKRIQKSVKLWQKEGGRRGYYDYLRNFMPGI